MTQLSPEGRALLERARADEDPTDADRERVRDALAARIAAGVATGGAATATALGAEAAISATAAATAGGTAAAGVTTGKWLLVGKWLLATALVGGAGAGWWLSKWDEAPTVAHAPMAEAVSDMRAPTPPPQRQAPEPKAPSTDTTPDEPAAKAPDEDVVDPRKLPWPKAATVSKAEAEARADASTPNDSTSNDGTANASAPNDGAADEGATNDPPAATLDALRAETALLRAAQQAAREGRYDAALALLDRHAKEHPRGQLSQEREAARLLIRCGRGDESAKRAGRAFAKGLGDSPLGNRIRNACR